MQKEKFAITSEQDKAIVRRFYEAFEANDQATFNELLAPDLVAYLPGTPGPQSREAMPQGISMVSAAFTESHFTIEDLVAEGNRVATRTTWRAIHSGDFQGLSATGKRIEIRGITVERIKEGKIV
jgi:steroid delta-isomerase-like uncharacterized protein